MTRSNLLALAGWLFSLALTLVGACTVSFGSLVIGVSNRWWIDLLGAVVALAGVYLIRWAARIDYRAEGVAA